MMHVKKASEILGLAASNKGGNISSLCRRGKIEGAEYIVSGWRVPEEWVYSRALKQATTSSCPKCKNKPLSVVPHEDYAQSRIICISCGLDVSTEEFVEIRIKMSENNYL